MWIPNVWMPILARRQSFSLLCRKPLSTNINHQTASCFSTDRRDSLTYKWSFKQCNISRTKQESYLWHLSVKFFYISSLAEHPISSIFLCRSLVFSNAYSCAKSTTTAYLLKSAVLIYLTLLKPVTNTWQFSKHKIIISSLFLFHLKEKNAIQLYVRTLPFGCKTRRRQR